MDCFVAMLLAMTWERKLLRRLAGTLPLVLRRDVLVSLDVLAVAFVPPVEDLRRDEDRGEGRGDDADEERERNIAERAARRREDEERERGEEGRRRRHDRAGENFPEGGVDDVAQR